LAASRPSAPDDEEEEEGEDEEDEATATDVLRFSFFNFFSFSTLFSLPQPYMSMPQARIVRLEAAFGFVLSRIKV